MGDVIIFDFPTPLVCNLKFWNYLALSSICKGRRGEPCDKETKMRYECINGCWNTWFAYIAISELEIEINENDEYIDRLTFGWKQSKATICRKCSEDATQIFEKCRDCGCWKEQLTKDLCSSCLEKRIAH